MILKALISVAGAVGVAGTASFALWQAGSLGSATTNTSPNEGDGMSLERVDLPSSLGEDRRNCVVIDTLGEDIFSGLGIKKEQYTAISCVKTNSQDSNTRISDNWTGLFPNEFLISDESLEEGTKFNMTTKTVDDEEEYGKYKTTFFGNSYFYSLSGDWDWGAVRVSEKSFKEVKVEESERRFDNSPSIYLYFQ